MAERIEVLIDKNMPGHTRPFAIEMLMDKVKSGQLVVELHSIPLPILGKKLYGKRYASISVRNEVMDWLDDERRKNHAGYSKAYGNLNVSELGPFAGPFILNALMSEDERNPTVRLKPETRQRAWKKYQAAQGRGWTGTFDEYVNTLLLKA